MDFYRIECFLAAAETGSMTKAAEKMCVTQPAISFQIRELERELPQLAAKVQGVSAKANKLSLSYPVVSMTSETHEGSVLALTQGDEALKDKLSIELHADADYPKTFLWANDDDPEVPPSNAKRLARRLESVGTQVLYCTYPWGGHGVGLGTGTGCEGWIDTMTNWMKEN